MPRPSCSTVSPAATDTAPETDEHDGGRALAAAVGLTVIAVAAFLLLPLYVGAAADDIGLSQSQLGFLAAAVAGGSALSSVAMMWLVRRVPWRPAACCSLLTLLIPMLLSIPVQSAGLFMLLQGTAALGSGATYSLALTALSDRRHPARAFGLSIAAQVAFQVAGMLLLPALVSRWGIDGVLLLFAALHLVGLALLRWLPRRGRAQPQPRSSAGMFSLPLVLALGGCFFFFFNVGALWTYVERMAVLAGFNAGLIGVSLAIGVAMGIPGALLAAWCGDRFGRAGPLALGAVGTLVALALLLGELTPVVYVAALALYNFVWNFSLAFQYAAVHAVDDSGQGVAAAPAFHAAGVAVGPALAALYVSETSLTAVNLVAGAGAILSLLCFGVAILLAGVRGRRETGAGYGPAD